MKTHLGWHFPDEETHFIEMLDKSISKGGLPVYQQPARLRAIELCKQKRLALDIGANVGLWARDLTDAFEQVFAFEPIPKFRDCLILNAPKATIIPVALGTTNTMVNMVITDGNMGNTHVQPGSEGQGTIEMRRLDDFELDNVDFIKVDCEGYELAVLQGAETTLKKNQPIVVVEQKHMNRYENNDAVSFLKSIGAKELSVVKADWILGWP